MSDLLKIEVPRAELKAALQVVAIGVEGGEDDKLTTHYTFRVTDGKVEILSSGPRVFASYQLENTKCSADTGSFTVPGWRLKGWVDVVTDETVSLEHEDAVTRLVSTKGSGKVQSLDAAQFPYWDATLAGATLTATVDPKPFLTGMDYAKRFTSDQDTKNPTLVLVECRNGLLHATDTLAFSLVEVPGLADVKIRVNNKDVSSVNAFMGLVGDGNKVEILETEKCQFFRSNGKLLVSPAGCTSFQHSTWTGTQPIRRRLPSRLPTCVVLSATWRSLPRSWTRPPISRSLNPRWVVGPASTCRRHPQPTRMSGIPWP